MYVKHFIIPGSIFHNTAEIEGYWCCQRSSKDYWETESTTNSNRQHYIWLRLRFLCPVTQTAISTVLTKGSLEVYLVLLPGSSENNASQKIIKEEVSGKEEVGTRIKECCTPTTPQEATREEGCRREVLFPLKHHTSVLESVAISDVSFSIHKTQIILPPEAEMFHSQRYFADSKLE